MTKHVSYATATAHGWQFVTTSDWRCYAWRMGPGGLIQRTVLVPMGDDRDIGTQYRSVLAEITRLMETHRGRE